MGAISHPTSGAHDRAAVTPNERTSHGAEREGGREGGSERGREGGRAYQRERSKSSGHVVAPVDGPERRFDARLIPMQADEAAPSAPGTS